MNPVHKIATENQTVSIQPRTANVLAVVLNFFADSVNAPHIRCNVESITEADIMRIVTLASLAVGRPSDEVNGLS